jgi:hypothetical protein
MAKAAPTALTRPLLAAPFSFRSMPSLSTLLDADADADAEEEVV